MNVRAFHGVDGTQSNVEVVRRLFERFAEGGVEGVLETMDAHVVIEIPPDMSAEPDTYRGHEGVLRYFAGFDGTIDHLRYEPVEFIPLGEHVLVRAHMGGRGVSSGVNVELEAFVLHELSGGKIVRMRPYPDRESAEAAAR